MASNNNIYKMSNAGGFKSLTRYYDMLAGNTVWNPWSPAGAYESIATTTVGSGGTATITFSSIPSTYTHLQIRSLSKMTSTAGSNDDGYIIRANSDTGSNYAWHMIYGVGSGSAFSTGGSSQTRMYPYGLPFAGNNGWGAMVTDVLDYGSTSKNKTFRYLSGYDDNGDGDVLLASGVWLNSSTAISSITFTSPYGNFAEYSSFALYGIRGN